MLEMRGDAGVNDPVFPSRKGGRLTERAVPTERIAASRRHYRGRLRLRVVTQSLVHLVIIRASQLVTNEAT